MSAASWQSLNAQVFTPELPAELDTHLRYFWEKETGLPERVFTIRAGRVPPVPVAASRGVWLIMEQQVVAHWHGNELWLEDGLHLEVGEQGANLVWEEQLPPPMAAWMLALTEAHRADGWLPLHAAAVASGPDAVALTGSSGAGKSTATLRLAALNYRVLAEDRTFWHAPTGQVTGLDRALRTFDDSLERFAPHYLAQQHGLDSKGKRLLPLPPGGPAHLKTLLLLQPDARRLSGAERVRALWDTTGLPLTELGRAQVQRGLQTLLPLLSAQVVTRETVIPTVQKLLDSSAVP